MIRKPLSKTKSRVRAKSRSADGKILEFPRVLNLQAVLPNWTPPTKTVNQNELTSIHALAAFVAQMNNWHETTVCECLHAEFDVATPADLQRADYERAIAYLVDLMDELKRH